MENWQLEAIQQLLEETPIKEVEDGERVYLSSETYGSSRFHLISKVFGTLQFEQVETDEKWSKRIQFFDDEVPALTKTLLLWYLAAFQARAERERREQEMKERIAAGMGEDPLGDLDTHPF